MLLLTDMGICDKEDLQRGLSSFLCKVYSERKKARSTRRSRFMFGLGSYDADLENFQVCQSGRAAVIYSLMQIAAFHKLHHKAGVLVILQACTIPLHGSRIQPLRIKDTTCEFPLPKLSAESASHALCTRCRWYWLP